MVGSAVQCVDLVCESGHGILHFLTQGFNNPVSDNSAHTHLHLHLLMFFSLLRSERNITFSTSFMGQFVQTTKSCVSKT